MLFRCKDAAGGLLVAALRTHRHCHSEERSDEESGSRRTRAEPRSLALLGMTSKGRVGKATYLRAFVQDRHYCFRGAICRMKQACIRATEEGSHRR